MSPISRACFVAVLVLTSSVLPASTLAQVFHLPPVFRPVLPKDDSVLVVTALTDSFKTGTIAIDDDRLILTRRDGSMDIISLAGREIRDVVNELRAKYKDDLRVSTQYPLLSTKYLRSTRPLRLSETSTRILANPDEPELGIGFGVVLALSDTDTSDEDQGLLSTTGFQLDLVGNYQVRGPEARESSGKVPYSILVYAQPRLSLAANQQLQVTNEQTTGTTSPTDSQLESAIEQADQVALSFQTDIVFPVQSTHLDFVLSPIYAVSWSRLSDPGFPDIVVGGEIKSVETLFEPTIVARAQKALRQTLPLSEYGLQGLFQFRRSQRSVFYFGGGILWREVTQPRVSFRRSGPNVEPDRLSLTANLATPDATVWRAFFGARLASVLDIRIDAAGPFGPRNSKPLLKVLLGRAFPTTPSSAN